MCRAVYIVRKYVFTFFLQSPKNVTSYVYCFVFSNNVYVLDCADHKIPVKLSYKCYVSAITNSHGSDVRVL